MEKVNSFVQYDTSEIQFKRAHFKNRHPVVIIIIDVIMCSLFADTFCMLDD